MSRSIHDEKAADCLYSTHAELSDSTRDKLDAIVRMMRLKGDVTNMTIERALVEIQLVLQSVLNLDDPVNGYGLPNCSINQRQPNGSPSSNFLRN